MDLEDGVDSTPGLLGGSQVRLAPFLGAHPYATESKPTQQQQQTKPGAGGNGNGNNGTGGQMTLTQRHNSALAVSIETDVWLLRKFWSLNVYSQLGRVMFICGMIFVLQWNVRCLQFSEHVKCSEFRPSLQVLFREEMCCFPNSLSLCLLSSRLISFITPSTHRSSRSRPVFRCNGDMETQPAAGAVVCAEAEHPAPLQTQNRPPKTWTCTGWPMLLRPVAPRRKPKKKTKTTQFLYKSFEYRYTHYNVLIYI